MATIIDWPDALRPASVEWGLVVPQRMGRSSFDGSAQAQTMGAPRWVFTITTGVMTLAEMPQWEAFIRRLRGMVNRTRVWDWRRETPLGPAGGAPVVRVAAAGASLETEGWTPSVGGILLAGSYLGINGELKTLSQTIASDASGRATITFEPPLRGTAPAAGAITLTKPKALFVLTSERPTFAQQGARATGATLSFEEVFA